MGLLGSPFPEEPPRPPAGEVRLLAPGHTLWRWGPPRASRARGETVFPQRLPPHQAPRDAGPSPPTGRGCWPFKSLVLAPPRGY